MTRRVGRAAPQVSGLGPLAQSIGASVQRALKPATPLGTPPTVPVQTFQRRQPTPLIGGYGSALIKADGTATVQVGPQGLGTIWYPQSAAIATTSGATDTSTCTVYVGPQGLQTQTAGQSYAAGGDTIGLSVPPLWPGYFIVAKWTGGKPGDLATVTVYGQQSALA